MGVWHHTHGTLQSTHGPPERLSTASERLIQPCLYTSASTAQYTLYSHTAQDHRPSEPCAVYGHTARSVYSHTASTLYIPIDSPSGSCLPRLLAEQTSWPLGRHGRQTCIPPTGYGAELARQAGGPCYSVPSFYGKKAKLALVEETPGRGMPREGLRRITRRASASYPPR